MDRKDKSTFGTAEKIRPEWVLKVTGSVRKRVAGAERENNPTGKVEVLVLAIEVLSEAKTPPLESGQEKKNRAVGD